MAPRNLDWSEHLPIDLFALILRKLPMPDHLRLSCVCARWRRAIMSQRIQAPSPQAPWLMLPDEDGDEEEDDDLDEEAAKFYSLSERRVYRVRLPLPPIADCVCVGSSHGWLIMVTDFLTVHLLNPLTRVQIKLPSLSTLPDYDGNCALDRMVFVHKAILSPPPSPDGGGEFAVIIIYHRPERLACLRAGDTSWKPMAGPGGIADFIHHKGKLHALCAHIFDQVYAWDTDFLLCPLQPPKSVASTELCRGYEQKYLVESLRGELLMVARKKNGYSTLDFKVVRLDVERKEWHQVSDLEDNILFVGSNYSMALSAKEFTEFRRNSIYFADDVKTMAFYKTDRLQSKDYLLRILSQSKGQPDAGVFSMKEQKIQWLDSSGSRFSWPPVWVTPSVL